MSKPQWTKADAPVGHWALVIGWSLGFGAWSFLNVVHLLQRPRAVHVLEKLLQRQVVEGAFGSLGQFLVEQVDGDLAGGAVVGRFPLLGAEPAFEPADHVADADVGRAAREAVPAVA